jgi:hypothetical protein
MLVSNHGKKFALMRRFISSMSFYSLYRVLPMIEPNVQPQSLRMMVISYRQTKTQANRQFFSRAVSRIYGQKSFLEISAKSSLVRFALIGFSEYGIYYLY